MSKFNDWLIKTQNTRNFHLILSLVVVVLMLFFDNLFHFAATKFLLVIFFSTEYTRLSRRLTRLSQFEKISTTKMAPMLSNFVFKCMYLVRQTAIAYRYWCILCTGAGISMAYACVLVTLKWCMCRWNVCGICSL